MPDVDGKSVDDATAELEAAGFDVSVQTKLTNQAPKGTVVFTAPLPGSSVEVGDTVTLTVAKPLPKIPNVVGKTLANAKRALKNAGFEVGKVTQQTSSKKKGTVISQSPDAGTSARPGRTVSLVTAKPAPAAVEQLHAGLLALLAAGVGLRLCGRHRGRSGVSQDPFGSRALIRMASTRMATGSAASRSDRRT